MTSSAGVLIDAGELHRLITDDPALVVLDVRWALGDPEGRAHHAAAHLPGAVYVDLETELSGPPGAGRGRHPLPDPEALEESARRWGIRTESDVVVYDDVGNLSAARAWWLLRWAGHASVRLLDGGLRAWRRAGYTLEAGPVLPERGDVTLAPGVLPALGAEEAAELARTGLLLDARAGERYRGEVEPVDPRAGHIPGAVSSPTSANLRPDGGFADAPELARRFAALGADRAQVIGVYCGSGITAAHELAALAIAGYDAVLYPGSWSEWVSDPVRPVALGAEPG
ncbi:MAG TPA: sulfurtransferase [Solirubrobacteraceae bacterium]|jgi:thiosulfate/3-mercaptopyruvate sulfurtransferase|nr:sulfurtransferase [Solirubrobacteraceae bacterium]